MAESYVVNITNGTGTQRVLAGTYSVTADVPGYDNTTLSPTSVTVANASGTYPFTIAATGTLTLHVTETGSATGTPIVGATFIRTDASGNEYGTAITTDSNGNAVFANVPYAASGAPTVYYKQTASDGEHQFETAVQSTTLTTATQTDQVTNAPAAEQTFNLTDANYENLPVESGTLNLS